MHGVIGNSTDSVSIKEMPEGLSRFRFDFYVPDDTVRIWRDAFVAGETVRLVSALPFASTSQDWGNPERNASVEHHTLRLGGEPYRFGIGSHANSSIVVDLCADGKCPTGKLEGNFHAVIGLDDESACGDGASFAVLAEGKELWRSKRLYSGDTSQVSIRISATRTLDLRVENGENMDCDHGDWANAWISGVK